MGESHDCARMIGTSGWGHLSFAIISILLVVVVPSNRLETHMPNGSSNHMSVALCALPLGAHLKYTVSYIMSRLLLHLELENQRGTIRTRWRGTPVGDP